VKNLGKGIVLRRVQQKGIDSHTAISGKGYSNWVSKRKDEAGVREGKIGNRWGEILDSPYRLVSDNV